MPETYEMLADLIELEMLGYIENLSCRHLDPANTPVEKCHVCFIRNMSNSPYEEGDPWFTDSTSKKQRDQIERLWQKYANLDIED